LLTYFVDPRPDFKHSQLLMSLSWKYNDEKQSSMMINRHEIMLTL